MKTDLPKCGAYVCNDVGLAFNCGRPPKHEGTCSRRPLVADASHLEELRLWAERKCEWCGEPIPPWMRSDAETCSKPCRQARNRFRVAPAGSAASKPIDRLAVGPSPRERVAVPAPGERCPRCHAPANAMRVRPCLLCRPDLVPVEFGGELDR